MLKKIFKFFGLTPATVGTCTIGEVQSLIDELATLRAHKASLEAERLQEKSNASARAHGLSAIDMEYGNRCSGDRYGENIELKFFILEDSGPCVRSPYDGSMTRRQIEKPVSILFTGRELKAIMAVAASQVFEKMNRIDDEIKLIDDEIIKTEAKKVVLLPPR